MRLAIPSDAPGGLDAAISDHFGHCDVFTLIDVDADTLGTVTLLDNGGHEHGGCMTPVMLLKDQGVDALIAGGMGGRPLAGFGEVGISVYFRETAKTVQEAARLYLDGDCKRLGQEQACGGGSGGGGGECGSHDHHDEPVERPAIDGPPVVQADRVVTVEFKLLDTDGNLLDSSEQSGPLTYLHGRNQMVPGFESAIEGTLPGDDFTAHIDPADGYGNHDPERIFEVPRDQVPDDASVGMVLQAQTNGGVVPLKIVGITDDKVSLDANHPMAGQSLTFEVKVLKVEAATEQELSHGHAH